MTITIIVVIFASVYALASYYAALNAREQIKPTDKKCHNHGCDGNLHQIKDGFFAYKCDQCQMMTKRTRDENNI